MCSHLYPAYKTANTLADLFSGNDGLFETRLRAMDADDFVVDLYGVDDRAQIGLAEGGSPSVIRSRMKEPNRSI